MKSTIQLVCPVSGARAKPVPYADSEEGTFLPHVEDAPPDLPVGWGRLVIDVVVRNPEIKTVLTARAQEMARAMETLEQAANDGSATAPQVREHIDSGAATKAAEEAINAELPLPEDRKVYLRLQYPVLSDEAVGAAIKALRDAGFPIEGPG